MPIMMRYVALVLLFAGSSVCAGMAEMDDVSLAQEAGQGSLLVAD